MKAIGGIALLTVLVLAAPAASAPACDARVRPAVGIGKVDLGMSLAQVKRAMGRHDTGWSELRGVDARYLELAWDGGPADFFSVGLLGRPGRLRVVTISTTRPTERTPEGIGPGSRVAVLKRKIRGLRFRCVWRSDGSGHIVRTEYQASGPRGRETVFVPGLNRFYRRDTTKHIAYVIVRERGVESGLRFTACR